MLYDGDERKNPEIYKNEFENQEKIPCFVALSSTDCFPVSKNTENKPDLP